jgi:subtilisin family serine protease
VLDTGINKNHPAFAGIADQIVEKDFTGTGNGDNQGHGTHCAGTIFGRAVDGKRIGVAPGVTKALIGKVLADDGSGNSDMIFAAIQWAVAEGAQVISMSLGFDFPGSVKRMTDDGWPIELATSTSLEGYRANLRMFDALMQMIKARAAFGLEPVVIAASGNESKTDLNPDFKIAASLRRRRRASSRSGRCNAAALCSR